MGAFAAFRWLVLAFNEARVPSDSAYQTAPNLARFRALSYGVFIWTSVQWVAEDGSTSLGLITPDLLVAAVAYCASATVLRMESGPATSLARGIILGVILALGYWVKAALFPLGLALLVGLLGVRAFSKRRLQDVAAAVVTFALLSVPLVYVISTEARRLTFSEVAPLSYAWYVAGVPMFAHWQGGPATGVAKYPTRQIYEDPAVYEFGNDFPEATYPPWYAPPYWHRGLTVDLSLAQQMASFGRTFKEYLEIVRKHQWEIASLVLLLGVSGGWRPAEGSIRLLLSWCLAAAIMYGLVHVEQRFIAAFVAIGTVSLLASLPVSVTSLPGKLRNSLSLLVVLGLVSRALFISSEAAASPSGKLLRHQIVAATLERSGIQDGDAVASIGNSFECYWAVLAGVRIVAEVPASEFIAFTSSPPSVQSKVYDRLGETGAKAIVASVFPSADPSEWTRIPNTGYLIRVLDSPHARRTTVPVAGHGSTPLQSR